MKKIIKPASFIIVLLLTLASALSFAPAARAAAFYTDIRVLISIGSPKTFEFTVNGDYYLKEDPSFELDGTMTLSVAGSRPILTSDSGTFTASTITLANRDYSGTSCRIRMKNAKYGMRSYLGDMTFDVADGGIRAINTLPVEHYLYGVVPYEMSNTFPMEALKAQAVCARGYAVAKCSTYRLRAYDIVDTSADQVYHGYNGSYTRAIAAVDETAGQVLAYDGDIIQAYYSASNGGQTERSGNAWPNDLPYYINADDPYDLANPSSLEEKSFIPLEFNDETLPLMDALVLHILQQGADEVAGEAVTLLATVRVKARDAKYDPPSRCYTKADVTLMVADAEGATGQLTVTIEFNDLIYSEKDNPEGIFNISRTMRMRGAEPGALKTEDGGTAEGWFLTNRRWGHGVGMSQRGAQQRATAGHSCEEILAFYYAGTQLTTIGTAASAPALTSEKWRVSETFISGIAPETTPGELLAKLASDGGTLHVISSSGAEKTNGRVSTGDFVRTVYGGGNSYFDLPVVICGDTDGDGRITQDDLDALRKHLMNTGRLTGAYLLAADVNRDGAADSLDVLQLMKHIQGALTIEQ
jgi:SpoIID/LytB domain protein